MFEHYKLPTWYPCRRNLFLSYLAEFPNLGLELAIQAAGIWWTLKLNVWITGNWLIPTWKSFFRSTLQTSCCSNIMSVEKKRSLSFCD